MADLGQTASSSSHRPAQLEQQLQAAAQKAQAAQAAPSNVTAAISGTCRLCAGSSKFSATTATRSAGWSNRMLAALRTFNGQYDPTKLAEITKWGGSTVYARLIAQKCRAASSLLRDIYLGQDPVVAAAAQAEPEVPAEIGQKIEQLIQQEGQQVAQQLGQPPSRRSGRAETPPA
jgi:hypothetical protein